MANEIRNTVSFVYNKDGSTFTLSSGTIGITVTGTKLIHSIVGISTNAADIDIGQVGQPIGAIVVRNIGNFNIDMGFDSANQPVRIAPKEFWCLRWAGNTINAKAATSSSNLEIFACDV